MDALNQASMDALQDPDVADQFPAWMWSAILDGRARPAHAARDGNYYPNGTSFFAVRDGNGYDGFNCRCTLVPVHADDWHALQAQGTRFSSYAELAVPKVRQQTDWTCGPAALLAAARFFGVSSSEEAVAGLAGSTPSGGTAPEQLALAAVRLGLAVRAVEPMSLAGLQRALIRGFPVLACLQAWGTAAEMAAGTSGHWVVCIGQDSGGVTVEDPALDATRGHLTWAQLAERWHDTDAAGTPYHRFGLIIEGQRMPAAYRPWLARGYRAVLEEGHWVLGDQPPADDTDDALARLADEPEVGKTGIFPDSLGRAYCWELGRRVTCPDNAPAAAQRRARLEKRLAQPPALVQSLDGPTATRFASLFATAALEPEALPALMGAPAGARVTARSSTIRPAPGAVEGPAVTVEADHPWIKHMQRTFFRDAQGQLVVHNDLFFVKKSFRRGGFGARVFASQVQQSALAGIRRMETLAGKGNGMNGYLTWPRLGYDAPLSSSLAGRLPANLAGAKTVQDLYASAEGRDWWAQHGDMIEMHFDLTPGSKSLKILDAYLASKGQQPLQITAEQVDRAHAARQGTYQAKRLASAEQNGQDWIAQLSASQGDRAAITAQAHALAARVERDHGIQPHEALRFGYRQAIAEDLVQNDGARTALDKQYADLHHAFYHDWAQRVGWDPAPLRTWAIDTARRAMANDFLQATHATAPRGTPLTWSGALHAAYEHARAAKSQDPALPVSELRSLP